mgnify:CR=1 FL=1
MLTFRSKSAVASDSEVGSQPAKIKTEFNMASKKVKQEKVTYFCLRI